MKSCRQLKPRCSKARAMLETTGHATKIEGHGWLHSYGPLATQALRMPEMVDDMIVGGARACTRCGETKAPSEFFSRKSKTGEYRILRSLCRVCTSTEAKERRARLGDRMRAQERASWRKNFEKNGHSKRVSGLDWRLRKVFGLTLGEYMQKLQEQNHACAICETPLQPVSAQAERHKTACVDHDHRTGKIRGLLCNPCNLAVGYMGDSLARVAALGAYLRRHQ